MPLPTKSKPAGNAVPSHQPVLSTQVKQTPPPPSSRDVAASRGAPVFFDGHDNAIIGTAARVVIPDRAAITVAVYDKETIINNLLEQGMEPDRAIEFFAQKIAGAWYAGGTPIIVKAIS